MATSDGSSNAATKEEAVQVEPKTGISFPMKLDDGKILYCVGYNKKSLLGLSIKAYGFEKAPSKPTEEMYQLAIDGDFGMTIKMVVSFSGVKLSMAKKGFTEAMRESMKKLTGQKNEELSNKVFGTTSDKIKLRLGSEMIVSKLPGYVLETKVNGELVSRVESELLCRAYFRNYLGEDTLECEKDSREMFGQSMLSLF
ncbi:hypothetical protein G4B88_007304 [Cannabis sativa]|uniref:Chalcone isomerase domain-containing protein n=1 Tax=Cannabis sativa TaxID=3483 RepID=A0A7J6FRD2_CANSA|nr:hypothetical protein G4B88_007304 [Cannabis sativa]